MNLVASLDEALPLGGYVLEKAQPRSSGQVTMELVDRAGQRCAAVWDRDTTAVLRLASQLAERTADDLVEVLGGGHVLVQHGGVDRHLEGLEELVRRPGAHLVAHRSERRAVVRLDADRYATVVRPGRTTPVVGPLTQLPGADVRLPSVLHVDERRGIVQLTAVAGPTLLERLSDADADDRELAREVGRLGVALRTFHEQRPTVARVLHDRAAEVAAARRWLQAATVHGLLQDESWRGLLDRVCATIVERPAAVAVLHRDLHDRHVLLENGGPVSLLHLDRVSYGDPALDLASLLVHLDLRALQGLCTAERAALCAAALLQGYEPDSQLSGRLAGYAGITRLRLMGVLCFRRAPAGLVEQMLDEMHAGSRHWLWQSWTGPR